MNVGTILRIAFRNLLQARRRTLLLGLAVAIVATLFLILRVVSGSVSERMIESATTLSAGHVNVGGFFKSRRKGADPVVVGRKRLRSAVERAVPEADSVIDRHRGWGRLIGPASSFNISLSGYSYDEEKRFFEALRLAPEREYKADGRDQAFGDLKDLAKPSTVLLFAAQAKKLEVGVGDTVTVVIEGGGGRTNTVDLSVAAIASDIGFMSNWTVFVPRKVILDLYDMADDTTGVVMVYLKTPEAASDVMERLRTSLAADGYTVMDHDGKPFWMKFDKIMGADWLGQQVDLTLWSDEISFVMWVGAALDVVSFFVVAVLAVIISGGVMNSMWMNVRERAKEIGTMRAIGAQKPFIVRLFLSEAAMLGFLAALAGVVIGCAAIALVNALSLPITNDGVRLFLMSNTLQFNLHVSQIVTTLVLFATITGAAALYPALKAARMRPVEALLHSK